MWGNIRSIVEMGCAQSCEMERFHQRDLNLEVFPNREEIIPIILPLIDKKVEELFKLLINPFCLSVSLRMVCGGGCQFNPKESVQFSCKFHDELGASIQYYPFA